MTSTSGPGVRPIPLFDLVTGFPPDDSIDVTVPMPLSLAVYMTMLESTGHAAELAVLHQLQTEQARETVRGIQARSGELTEAASAPLRITHIVEQRVPRVNGLRPHLHAYVGATVRSPVDGTEVPVDVDRLAALGDSDLFGDYRDRLAAASAERVGLVWGPTPWSPREVVGPRWLDERAERARYEDASCRGPWPRRQIVVGKPR